VLAIVVVFVVFVVFAVVVGVLVVSVVVCDFFAPVLRNRCSWVPASSAAELETAQERRHKTTRNKK